MPTFHILQRESTQGGAFGGVPVGDYWLLESSDLPAKYFAGKARHESLERALDTARAMARRCRTPTSTILLLDERKQILRAWRFAIMEEEIDPAELSA